MSKSFETVLSGLRELGMKKLAEIESVYEGHQSWLSSAVEDVKRQLAEHGPAIKKRRTGPDTEDVVISEPAKASILCIWGVLFDILVPQSLQLTHFIFFAGFWST